MTDKDRKLAEEMDKLLEKYVIHDEEGLGTDCFFWDDVKELSKEYAELYHEAKMKEITDEDIERQVKQINRREALCTVDYYSTGFIAGAKAMRDGEIKHTEGG